MADAAAEMDTIYRWQRHIYDASRKFYLLGRDGLLDELRPPVGGTVLEIGCGTGRNLIQAARRSPAARFHGVDVSAAMLETAAASVARAGLSHRIRLAQADARTLDAEAVLGVAAFDRVFLSYALSMIPPWQEALERALAAVAPGGSLHIVDFGMQRTWPGVLRAPLRAWLRHFSVEPRAALADEVLRLAHVAGAHATVERPFRDYVFHAVVRTAAMAPPVRALGRVSGDQLADEDRR